jgi:hypothetical protein
MIFRRISYDSSPEDSKEFWFIVQDNLPSKKNTPATLDSEDLEEVLYPIALVDEKIHFLTKAEAICV